MVKPISSFESQGSSELSEATLEFADTVGASMMDYINISADIARFYGNARCSLREFALVHAGDPSVDSKESVLGILGVQLEVRASEHATVAREIEAADQYPQSRQLLIRLASSKNA